MKACHGLECKDKRKPANHGKDTADGDAQALKGMIKRSYNDDYGPGTQNLVRHLAAKYPHSKDEKKTRYYGTNEGPVLGNSLYLHVYQDYC